ncbi:MAG: type II toxin-antitoxin system VapC family toxin [Rhodospirillales bacterium]|nr:type II toxin-antitoxin system VapC family toxin [Rhodospirillales bacterium]
MRLVLDASVTVKWLVVEEDADVARELATSGQDLHAPRQMAAEIANALWRKAQSGEIERRAADILMTNVSDMPVHWGVDELFADDAMRLALALDYPVYDYVYLALAHRIGATVVTADRRFAAAVALTEHGESVLVLADYAAAQ